MNLIFRRQRNGNWRNEKLVASSTPLDPRNFCRDGELADVASLSTYIISMSLSKHSISWCRVPACFLTIATYHKIDLGNAPRNTEQVSVL